MITSISYNTEDAELNEVDCFSTKFNVDHTDIQAAGYTSDDYYVKVTRERIEDVLMNYSYTVEVHYTIESSERDRYDDTDTFWVNFLEK